MYKTLTGALCGLLLTTSVAAQDPAEPPSPRQMMLAAGYKAMFTCSATFNASKTPVQIAAHELDNIYHDYEPAMALLPDAVIDQEKKLVSVAYDEAMPPRISVWNQFTGCTAQPPGTAIATIRKAPAVVMQRPDYSRISWPRGDKVSPQEPNPALEAVIDGAFGDMFSGRTSAVVIVKNGELISERYLEGFDIHTSQRTWSVAKSIAATLVGAAVHDGTVELNEPTGLSQWSAPGDPRKAITLEHLLHMASGLDSGPAGNRTDDVYFGGGLINQHATRGALEAEPGKRWKYANNDTMLAILTVVEKTGGPRLYNADIILILNILGMRHTVPETDWEGNYVLSSQVWTTARDLARLGILYLNDGVWEGKRILPEGWAEYVATPAPAQPPCRSDNGCRGYGAQFWLYKDYPGVPNDTYAALGNRGQFVIIVPSRNVVIVRRGYDWRGNRFDGPKFTAAVLEALE